MDKLNVSLLENIPEQNLRTKINQIFSILLNEIHFLLDLDIINPQVELIYPYNETLPKVEEPKVLDLGVKRSIENNVLKIKIIEEYKKYLPIIILREAYYCFVPNELKYNDIVKTFINQIVEIDLKKFNIIKDWKSLVRHEIVDYDFLYAEYDKIETFFILEGTKLTESPFKFFFRYIRRNFSLINDMKENRKDFYDTLWREFIFKSSKNLKDDEFIEALRVIIKIFYDVKSYRALLEYNFNILA